MLTAQGVAVSAVEGNDTGAITVATFTTPDLNSQVGDFIAVVSWGDGTTDIASVSGGNGSFTVTDDHTYAEKGSYPIRVQISDTVTGGSTSASTTATVTDAPLTLTGGFQLGDALSNPPNSFTVASFTDANPNAPLSDYTVNINWGDGNSSSGNYVQSAGDGVYLIVAPHNYTLPFGTPGPLTRTVTVTLTDVDGSSASTTSMVVVGQLQAGVPVTMGELQFMDANTYAKASDFVAQGQTGMALINWGDGTSSLGTVSGGPGNGSGPQPFTITGVHTYAQDSYDQPNGQYAVTTTVTDVDGNVLTGTQYISVVRPPVTLDTGNIETPLNSLTLDSVQVAAFTVPDATDAQGEFSAMIDWGDNSSNSGVIQAVSPGLFEVLGSHDYAVAGGYTILVQLSQGWITQKLVAAKPEAEQAEKTPAIVVTEMQFTGGYSVLNDSTGTKFSRPQYQGDKTGKATVENPYVYVRNTKLELSRLDFRVTKGNFDTFRGKTLFFRGTLMSGGKPLGVTIQNTQAETGPGGDYLITDAANPDTAIMTSNNPLAKTVNAFSPLVINWQYSFDGKTGWKDAGKTENPIYITYAEPARPLFTGSDLFQTVVAYGSVAGKGLTNPKDILNAIWSNFSTDNKGPANAKDAAGKPLSYYGSWKGAQPTMAGLLADLDGQCGAWAKLFEASILRKDSPVIQVLRNWKSTRFGFMTRTGYSVRAAFPSWSTVGNLPRREPKVWLGIRIRIGSMRRYQVRQVQAAILLLGRLTIVGRMLLGRSRRSCTPRALPARIASGRLRPSTIIL